MSIDMKSFSGEIENVPAAVEQNQLNIPQEESQIEDFSMPEIPVEKKQESQPPVVEEAPRETMQERNFKALSEEVEKLKAEREADRRNHQLQMDLFRANSQPLRSQEPPKQKAMFDGMSDTDIPNVAEIRKEWESRESQYQNRIQELQVAQFHPDYAEVVEKFAAPLLKEKPHLVSSVLGAENKALALYEIGKLAQQAKASSSQVNQAPPIQQQVPQQPKMQQKTVAERIVENARKPGNLASAGGQSVLSKADYFASMSDEDFMKIAKKNLEAI